MPVRSLTRIAAVPLALLILLVGVWWGGHPRDMPEFMRDAFVADHDTAVLSEAVNEVRQDYYRPLSRQQLVNSSIDGLIAGLHDRFSQYLDPRAYAAFNASAREQFSGIGVDVVTVPRGQHVVEVFDRSPAARAGIAAGDLIVEVDHRSLAGMRGEAAKNLIRGRPGTDVLLTILHAGRRRTVRVTRAEVSVPAAASSMHTFGGVKFGQVALQSFSSGAHGDVRAGIDRLLAQGARGIVLDLRDNPGGLVDEARLVASIFLADGPIVTTRGRTQPTQTLTATGGAIAAKIPVAVLVDANTASAAEIVAGALQDRHRATIVGTHTFGKGVFQEVRPLSNGGAIDITVGEYFLPSGRNLGGGGIKQGAGVQPDVRVTAQPTAGSDPALQAALRVLAGRVR